MKIYLVVEDIYGYGVEHWAFENYSVALAFAKSKITDYILDCVELNDMDSAVKYIKSLKITNKDMFAVADDDGELYIEELEVH